MVKVKNNVKFKNVPVINVVMKNIKEAQVYVKDWLDIPNISSQVIDAPDSIEAMKQAVENAYSYLEYDQVQIDHVVPAQHDIGVMLECTLRIPVRREVAENILALDKSITKKHADAAEIDKRVKELKKQAMVLRQEAYKDAAAGVI